MFTFSTVLVIGAILVPTGYLWAQADTASHRALYAEINARAADLTQSRTTLDDDDVTWQLTGWFDGQTLHKIHATVPGEDGDGFEEYYLQDAQPVFVFRSYKAATEAGKIEDRFYFRQGRLFRWLGNDKKIISPESPEFAAEATRLKENYARFVAKLINKPVPAVANQTSGKFLRIDQGDYFHWVIEDAQGNEHTFFILQPDAVIQKTLDAPEKYIGKRCRVSWSQSQVNIPEAGGMQDITQITSVSWE